MRNSKLQNVRQACGLSQSELATAAGINTRMHQYYEQGAKDLSKASLATMLKLCTTLHCKLEDILPDGEAITLLARYRAM